MKNTFGNALMMTVFGESHGPSVGVVLDGLAPGIDVNEDEIRAELSLRRPQGKISTARVEADEFVLASGVFNGKTTGTPLCIMIPNTNTKSGDYNYGVARPGHSDLTAYFKYHGFEDYRGGGHFSARLTAPIVAAGALLRSALKEKGIRIGTHIAKLGGIADRDFGDLADDLDALHAKYFPTLSDEAGDKMRETIEAVAAEGDSIGGILETAILGVPAGVGEPFFDSVESELSHLMFSVPAVKGVEFGAGFGFADLRGSTANDPIRAEDGGYTFGRNNNGGINGGITNGAPILMRLAVKPTPSIYKTQDSVNFLTHENAEHVGKGRHDPAVIHRARIVVDSLAALGIADLLTVRYGTDWLAQ